MYYCCDTWLCDLHIIISCLFVIVILTSINIKLLLVILKKADKNMTSSDFVMTQSVCPTYNSQCSFIAEHCFEYLNQCFGYFIQQSMNVDMNCRTYFMIFHDPNHLEIKVCSMPTELFEFIERRLGICRFGTFGMIIPNDSSCVDASHDEKLEDFLDDLIKSLNLTELRVTYVNRRRKSSKIVLTRPFYGGKGSIFEYDSSTERDVQEGLSDLEQLVARASEERWRLKMYTEAMKEATGHGYSLDQVDHKHLSELNPIWRFIPELEHLSDNAGLIDVHNMLKKAYEWNSCPMLLKQGQAYAELHYGTQWVYEHTNRCQTFWDHYRFGDGLDVSLTTPVTEIYSRAKVLRPKL